MALVTCGSVYAGDAPNAVPDKALLNVDIHAYSPEIPNQAVKALHRVIKAECEASGVSRNPKIKESEHVPPLVCDDETVATTTIEFDEFFGQEHTETMILDAASDDFSIFAPKGVPHAYWNISCEDNLKWQRLVMRAG